MKSEEELKTIYEDEQVSKEKVSANDTDLLDTAKKDYQSLDPEYISRNRIYTQLLESYFHDSKSKSRAKRWYKLIFYITTLLCFVGIITISLYALLVVARKETATVADAGTVLGSIAGIVSSLIILPKIIAEHLFPKDDDSHMISMVKNMQQNDSQIRRGFNR